MYADLGEFSEAAVPQPTANVTGYFIASRFSTGNAPGPSGTLEESLSHFFPADLFGGSPLVQQVSALNQNKLPEQTAKPTLATHGPSTLIGLDEPEK